MKMSVHNNYKNELSTQLIENISANPRPATLPPQATPSCTVITPVNRVDSATTRGGVKAPSPYSRREIEQFWVGLLDGDGSIQCNHWRKRNLQYRFCIKLKYHPKNLEMLQLISAVIGGNVRLVKSDAVLWVENHQRRIWKLSEILSRYPPLTSRVYHQWQFLKECGRRKNVSWMLANRTHKYDGCSEYVARARSCGSAPILGHSYWPIWCSGFIEAEGCFSVGSVAYPSFSIGQKNDGYLIAALRDYFAGVNKVRLVKDQLYHWQVYRRDVLVRIRDHCRHYPLLGEKGVSAKHFFKHKSLL